MNDKRKANSVISTSIDPVAGTLTIGVDGVAEPLILAIADVAPENVAYAALHGLKQRVCDAAALDRDDYPDRKIPPIDKWTAMRRLVEHYASGAAEWGIRVASGEGTGGGIILRAAAAVQGTDVATMSKRADSVAEKKGVSRRSVLAKWAAYPAIAAEINRIRAERAGEIDADEMTAELSGE